MKCPLRWSLWLTALVVAVVLCGAWDSPGQAKKGASGPAKKKPPAVTGATPKTAPLSKKAPVAKPSPDAGAPPAKPAPETEILEKLPPELQDPLAHPAPSKAEPPGPLGPYRALAPGVMRVITPYRLQEESVSVHSVPEFHQFGLGKDVPFRRDVWALEFRFKPMRILEVDVPQPSGKMQRKPIWYLIYCVTNRGQVKRHVEQSEPVEQPDRTFKTFKLAFDDQVEEVVPQPDGTLKRQSGDAVLFVPAFLLHSVNTGKRYPDRVIPVAVAAIRAREDPNRPLFDSVGIVRELKRGETAWGIATWEDVDPKTDRFSVYVDGLTNGYTWDDPPGPYQKGDPVGEGRLLWRTTLKLNFWRPGNERDLEESQIRFGIPGEPEYKWVYCDGNFNEKPRSSDEKAGQAGGTATPGDNQGQGN